MASNATQLGLGVLAAAAIGAVALVVAPPVSRDDQTAETDPAIAAVDDAVVEATAVQDVATATPETEAVEETATEPEAVEKVVVEATPEPEAVEETVVTVTPEPEATEEAALDATPEPEVIEETVVDAKPEPEVAAVAVVAAPQPPNRPTLDTFYMQPDGFATLAGRAEAGQAVAIIVAGDRVADVQAGRDGSFAAAFFLDASDQPRRLTVLADPDGAAIAAASSVMVEPSAVTTSAPADETIVVGAVTVPEEDAPEDAVPETSPIEADTPLVAEASAGSSADTSADIASEEEPLQVDTAPTPNVTTDPVQVAEADPVEDVPTADDIVAVAAPEDSTPTTEAPSDQTNQIPDIADTTEEPAPGTDAVADNAVASQDDEDTAAASPTVIVADSDGVRVLQDGTGPDVLSSIALDTITYDPAGEVVLGGRATGDGFVQVYINNQPVKTTRIDAGNWRTDLPDIDTGVYTLRVDEVDAEGAVVSRIETPFKREEPAAVAAVMAEETGRDGFDVAVRTVQAGSTLWAIAQEEMGEGIMYVAVYEANRDLIRDPDLIYPGQVFRIPQMPQDQ